VELEQARAFYDKFWRLHVDSRSSASSSAANIGAEKGLGRRSKRYKMRGPGRRESDRA